MSWIRKYPTATTSKLNNQPTLRPQPQPLAQPVIVQQTPRPQEQPVVVQQPRQQPPPSRVLLQTIDDYLTLSSYSTNTETSIRDSAGNFLIYDVFIRRNTLYLVSTFYAQGTPKINIFIDGVIPNEVAFDQGEPIRYFWMSVGNKKEFTCRINGITKTLKPEVIDGRNRVHKMAVATLFKYESPEDIQRFVSYYRKEGADQFYFYYNGAQLPEGLPKSGDINYKIWNFPYWNETTYGHNAQMTFLTSYRLRYFEANEWNVMIDMDEYIFSKIPNKTILEYLNSSNWHLIRIQSHWAKVSEDNASVNINKMPTPRYNKYIYRHFFKPLFGIHSPKMFSNQEYLEGGDVNTLYIAHVTNMKNKYTTIYSTNNERESLLEVDAEVRPIFSDPQPLPAQTQVLQIETQ